MNRKRIIVFGAGKEIDFFVKNIFEKVQIIAFGADKSNISGAADTITFCEENNVPILYSYFEIEKYNPDAIFLMSYPPLIIEEYFTKYLFLNVHMALLPKYRGIHGNTWAIINGEKFHGYTLHKVVDGIDNGPIYHQAKIEATLNDDINTIREKIFEKFKLEIIDAFINAINLNSKPYAQDETQAIYVTKRKPEDSRIWWNDTAFNIHNKVRALKPPYTTGAFCFYKELPLYITNSELVDCPSYISTTGKVVANFKNKGVYIKCVDKVLLVKEVSYDGINYKADSFFKSVGTLLK
jgi:methionyl-tRNA formyltransferase